MPDYREWPISFGNYGYLALYRLDGGDVVLLAIRHGRELDYGGP
jgi:plasmid stabilization system protein ParE